MELRLFLEHRFRHTPDGHYWSPFFGYDVWTRYLQIFERVTLCARVSDIPAPTPDLGRVDGEGVSLDPLPYYQGPLAYLKVRGQFHAAVDRVCSHRAAYIVRPPGNIAAAATAALAARGIPYTVEVVADPWDMFSPGAARHPLRPFFRRMFRRQTQRQCLDAAASLYVTRGALQRRYPPSPAAFSTGVSDVVLADGAFVPAGRAKEYFQARPLQLVCVGSFHLLYKAQDVLVKALGRLARNGHDLRLTFIGDGVYRPEIEQLVARDPHLAGRVRFAGQVKGGQGVRDLLDASHLFVLPSRQEGLPRAVLEAMARGLPCVGSDVGGFPELLTPDTIVRPNDVGGLARCIEQLVSSPERMAELSARNLAHAQDFHRDKLLPQQHEFYRHVKDLFARHWAPGV